MNDYNMLAMLYRLDQTHTYTYKGTHTHFHIHNYLHAQTHRLEKVKLNIALGGESTECGITKLGVRNASQNPNARDLLNSDSTSRGD